MTNNNNSLISNVNNNNINNKPNQPPSNLFEESSVGNDPMMMMRMQQRHPSSPPHLTSLNYSNNNSNGSLNPTTTTNHLIPSAPSDFPQIQHVVVPISRVPPSSSIVATTLPSSNSMLLPQKKRYQTAMKTSPSSMNSVMNPHHHHPHQHHHHHQDGDSDSSHSSHSSSEGPHLSSDESELPSSTASSNALMMVDMSTIRLPLFRRRKQSKASTVSKSSSSSSGISSNLLSHSTYEVSHHHPHGNPPEPTLSFNNQHFVTSNFTFKCVQGFILNDSKKAPPDTDYNLTIRDSLFIESPHFSKCVCVLKLKDGSSSGVTVSKEVFKPNNSNNSTTFECTIIIPQRITSMKGSSSSRIGYIEILNPNDECIAVSSSFWIRSRSRLQLDKDSKRKQEPVQVASTDLKRKREHEEDHDSSDMAVTHEPKIKSVKVESSMIDSEHVKQNLVVVASEPHQTFENSSMSNTLPPISNLYSSVTLESLFAEIQQLKQHIYYQHQQIDYLHQRLGNQSSSSLNKQ
ncbi:hypothetical protein C9374_008525 [Naegleria lovaniensis]|uniref:Uncharacterized protein n=1 Tax=Naegleria lovaniensis TaxID=51637 RepID=A0AA88GFA2_NAELO|nr:uncharacterized protein C9374_008525 [Naegleria lovaniensis]KAG2378382.1 hypothetical protein C9374_008525 [Naegleria lovaniensis]